MNPQIQTRIQVAATKIYNMASESSGMLREAEQFLADTACIPYIFGSLSFGKFDGNWELRILSCGEYIHYTNIPMLNRIYAAEQVPAFLAAFAQHLEQIVGK